MERVGSVVVCGWCLSLKCEIHHTRLIEVPNKEQSVQVDKEPRTFSLFFCMKVGCSKKKKRESKKQTPKSKKDEEQE